MTKAGMKAKQFSLSSIIEMMGFTHFLTVFVTGLLKPLPREMSRLIYWLIKAF